MTQLSWMFSENHTYIRSKSIFYIYIWTTSVTIIFQIFKKMSKLELIFWKWSRINSGKSCLQYAVNSAGVKFTKTLICNISRLDLDTKMVNTILNLAKQGLGIGDKIFEDGTGKFCAKCIQMHIKSSKLFCWPILGKIL